MKKAIKTITAVLLSGAIIFSSPIFASAANAGSEINIQNFSTSWVGKKLATGSYYTSSVDKIDKSDNSAQCDSAKISGNKLTIHASFGRFDNDNKYSLITRKLTLKKGCEIRVFEGEGDTGKAVSKKQFNKWFKKGTKDRLYCVIQLNIKNGKVTGIYMGP